MIPKSGNRFSAKIMRQQNCMIPKKPVPDLIRDGNRFSAKIMCKSKNSWGGFPVQDPDLEPQSGGGRKAAFARS